MHAEWTRDDTVVTTDPARVDMDVVHGFLVTAYWCAGIPRERLTQAIANSIPFSAWVGGRQLGFARVVTDRATFAYLADVFVLPEHRGNGLAARMMECIVAHPDLQGLRRWILLTRDAHGLYAKFGFTPPAAPERWMERWDPKVYERRG